jgi:hypothetical protein
LYTSDLAYKNSVNFDHPHSVGTRHETYRFEVDLLGAIIGKELGPGMDPPHWVRLSKKQTILTKPTNSLTMEM